MAHQRHRTRKRRASRSLWVLIAALIGFGGLLWFDHRDRPGPAPPAAIDRRQVVAAAIAALREDPSIADAVYAPAGDQWDVTPATANTDATSFARYVCFVLDARHVARPTTRVRVIDDRALEASGFDYNMASRGRLACEAETR